MSKVERLELDDKGSDFQKGLQSLFLVSAALLEHNEDELVIAQSMINNKVIRVRIDIPPEDEVFSESDV